VVALRPEQAETNLQVHLDHFETVRGDRVLFLVPRVSESVQRRWYPIKSALRGSAARGTALLVGARYGSGAYAEDLRKLWQTNESAFLPPVFAPPGDGIPIYRLLLAAISQRETHADAIFVFPGIDDIRCGTGLDEYSMALHAILATFDARAASSTRLVLASPPPYPAEPVRARACQEAVLRVARERCWIVADLRDALSAPSGSAENSPVIPRHPEAADQNRIARFILARAALTGADAWVPLMLPTGVLLCVSGALLWLCLRARHRPARRKTKPAA